MNDTEEGISIVIPAFNEEGAVGEQVEAIQKVLAHLGVASEIIVVDDGSTDQTPNNALRQGAFVIQHTENRGYGAAIKTGIRMALYDNIVITDADGTYPSDQIPALLDQLRFADMVVGARTGTEVHIPWIRRPAKWVVGKLAEYIAGQKIPDLNSGLRVFRRKVIEQYFSMLSNRFSFTTTSTLALLGDDYHIVYHPINYYQRVGKSKIQPRHFMDFVILVLRMAMLFQPLKVFVPLACASLLGGILKSGLDIFLVVERLATYGSETLYQPVLSTSALLLFMAGLQFFAVGMVADGILRRMAQHNRPATPSRSLVSYEFKNLDNTLEMTTKDDGVK